MISDCDAVNDALSRMYVNCAKGWNIGYDGDFRISSNKSCQVDMERNLLMLDRESSTR